MAVFSTNQVRNFYVVKALEKTKLDLSKAVGTLQIKDNKGAGDNDRFFLYRGTKGLMRSDLIQNVESVKFTDAEKMRRALTGYEVTLDPKVNGGKPIAGQDYMVKINFRQFVSISDETNYYKYGIVHAYKSMADDEHAASIFYAKMAQSLARNFSRELTKLVSIHLLSGDLSGDEAGTDEGEVLANSTFAESTTDSGKDFNPYTTTFTGILIEEAEQEWHLGTEEDTPVYFSVNTDAITYDGDEVIWGQVKEATPTNEYVANGKTIADMEYFFLGERGDIYRGVGWPNVIHNEYLVDPSLEYNTVDIHFSYIGSNESVQKSEKTVTLAIPRVGATRSEYNKLSKEVVGAINTAFGTNLTVNVTD